MGGLLIRLLKRDLFMKQELFFVRWELKPENGDSLGYLSVVQTENKYSTKSKLLNPLRQIQIKSVFIDFNCLKRVSP